MYFTKIRLNGGTDVDFPIIGALPSDTYILKAVDGLGPPDVNVIILDNVYQGRETANRQIVMRVGLNPNYGVNQTPEQLRSTLYKMLTLDYTSALRFSLMDGGIIVAIVDGYISKMEVAHFAKDPEVQITIECLQPYLLAPNPTVLVPTTKATFPVVNPGTASTWFKADFNITGTIANFTLSRNLKPLEQMKIQTTLLPGDVLSIDTRDGQKNITYTRAGKTENAVGILSIDSIWLELYAGLNTLKTSSAAFNWGSITFTPRYWGV